MKCREPITALELRSMGACEKQILTFEREWPEGCAITRRNALRAAELNLDIGFLTDEWAAGKWESYRKLRNVMQSTGGHAYYYACALAIYGVCRGKTAGEILR